MEGGKYDKFNYVPKKMIAQLQFLGALEIDWFAFGRRQLAISTSIAKIIEINIIWEPISSKCKPVFPIQGFSTTMRGVKIIFIYPRFSTQINGNVDGTLEFKGNGIINFKHKNFKCYIIIVQLTKDQ